MRQQFYELDGLLPAPLAGVRDATLRGCVSLVGRVRGLLGRLKHNWQTLREATRRFSSLVMARLHAREAEDAQKVSGALRFEVAPPISVEVQWVRASAVVICAVKTADAVGRLHSAADEQLEAAAYGLRSVLDELQAVMAITRMGSEPLAFRLDRPAAVSRARTGRAIAA